MKTDTKAILWAEIRNLYLTFNMILHYKIYGYWDIMEAHFKEFLSIIYTSFFYLFRQINKIIIYSHTFIFHSTKYFILMFYLFK